MKRLWELVFGSWVTVAQGDVDVSMVGIFRGTWEEKQHATIQIHSRSKKLRGYRVNMLGRKEEIAEWLCTKLMAELLARQDAEAKINVVQGG